MLPTVPPPKIIQERHERGKQILVWERPLLGKVVKMKLGFKVGDLIWWVKISWIDKIFVVISDFINKILYLQGARQKSPGVARSGK